MLLKFNTEALPLKVEDLTVAYGDKPPILEGVSFQVASGQIVSILGGSGCGKSSLLRHIIGLEKLRAGNIFIFGEDLWGGGGLWLDEIRRLFGMMYQGGALFGSMTVLENVLLPLREFSALSARACVEAARVKLALVGLEGFEHYLPSQISGGMRKRAAIARALALDPKLIFLDEPSAGLDPITSGELDNLITTLAQSLHLAFVIVSHELASIMAISDFSIMLDKEAKGIIAQGPPWELAEHSDNPKVKKFFERYLAAHRSNN